MSAWSWHLWYPGVSSFMHYLSGPPPPCREPILTTHCLASEDWWNPDLGLHDLITATCACLQSQHHVGSTARFCDQLPFITVAQGTLPRHSQAVLKEFEFSQVRAFGGWGLVLSVLVQSKKFLFNDVSLSVNYSCFPSIPCLWLWTRSCPFPCRAAHFVSLWCICCLSL